MSVECAKLQHISVVITSCEASYFLHCPANNVSTFQYANYYVSQEHLQKMHRIEWFSVLVNSVQSSTNPGYLQNVSADCISPTAKINTQIYIWHSYKTVIISEVMSAVIGSHTRKLMRIIASGIYKPMCLRCFDAVGWVAGRAATHPACKKMSGGMLAWLCVWVKVQICIWPSWCHCHSLSLVPVNPDRF